MAGIPTGYMDTVLQAEIIKQGPPLTETGGGKQSTWEELKKQGSQHYKTGGVEPVDLYLSGGMFVPFALCSIIKYAFRQRDGIKVEDCDKIIDYAQKLKAVAKHQ